ncbi:hypothetical protein CsSME_00019428 [Camellia sinensis var. sinensis]
MAQKTYVVFQPPHHHKNDNDNDDFQDSCRSSLPPKPRPQSQPLKPSPSANTVHPSKRPKPPLGLGSSFPSKPATTPHHFYPDFTTNQLTSRNTKMKIYCSATVDTAMELRINEPQNNFTIPLCR